MRPELSRSDFPAKGREIPAACSLARKSLRVNVDLFFIIMDSGVPTRKYLKDQHLSQ
jgi:hypothetical protein